MGELIIGIDPGPEESGWAVLETESAKVLEFGKESNSELRGRLRDSRFELKAAIIEFTPPYAMVMRKTKKNKTPRVHIPRQVVDTAIEIGRFIEVAEASVIAHELLHRQAIKTQLLTRTLGNDSLMIDALCDRYGGDRKSAKGTKKQPGPLFGMNKDAWQALAVARAWWELTGGRW